MVHQNVCRRSVQAPIPHEDIEDGSADRAVPGGGARGCPESLQAFASLGGAAARHTVGERHRVHRAGAGAADGLDANSLVLQELVERTPGESAVGAAALQGELDRLLSLTFHPTSPDPGSEYRGVAAFAVLSNVREVDADVARRRKSPPDPNPSAWHCIPSVFPADHRREGRGITLTMRGGVGPWLAPSHFPLPAGEKRLSASKKHPFNVENALYNSHLESISRGCRQRNSAPPKPSWQRIGSGIWNLPLWETLITSFLWISHYHQF